MDQPKIDRVLRLIKLMSGTTYFSINELAGKMGTSYRTIYRYIETFKEAGFVVEKIHGSYYRIMKMPKEVKNLENLIYFSEEEARVLSGLIQGLDGSNGLKANLYGKLSAIYDITDIERYTRDKGTAAKIEALSDAIRDRRQVVLRKYSSSHSGTSRDITVEPYEFSGEYVSVYAFDVEKKENRIYKIARIASVDENGEEWQFGGEHRKGVMDIFRMISHRQTRVKLELSRRAMNLLTEEFPMAEKDLTPIKDAEDGERWMLDTEVSAMEGVGRFVVGLAGDVRINDSPELEAYVRDFARNNIAKLTK